MSACPQTAGVRADITQRPLSAKLDKTQTEHKESALHPFADRKRTFISVVRVPRTDSCAATEALLLFNHIVRLGEQRGWHDEAEGFGGLEIDHQLELGRLLDG
jgi:hypothetical protein